MEAIISWTIVRNFVEKQKKCWSKFVRFMELSGTLELRK